MNTPSTPDPDDPGSLARRLRALGDHPIEPTVQGRHLAAMAEVGRRRPRRRLRSRLQVGLAFLAGLIIGGSGLAAAGALPGPAQEVAHDVLGAVGVEVPTRHGTERSTAGCPDGMTFDNHGQYVSWVASQDGDVEAASESDCGKPVKSVGGDEIGGDASSEHTGEGGPGRSADAHAARDENPCRPPWAGPDKPWSDIDDSAERERVKDEAKAAWTPPEGCEDGADEAEAGATGSGLAHESEGAGPPDDAPPEDAPPDDAPPQDAPPEDAPLEGTGAGGGEGSDLGA